MFGHFQPRRVCAIALMCCILAGSTTVLADDVAKSISTNLQKAKSRLMGMQYDKALEHFKDAKEALTTLRKEHPDHDELDELQKKYDKVAKDFEKKIVQRASRALKPNESYLRDKLSDDDVDAIRSARAKLAEALDEYREALEVAGGTSGAELIKKADGLVAEADAKLGSKPSTSAKKAEPVAAKSNDDKPAGDPKAIYSEIQTKFREARSLETAELVNLADEIRSLIDDLERADPSHSRIADFRKKVDKMVADAYAADVREARNEFDGRIRRIEMYLERDREDERPQLKKQRDLLVEALSKYGPALRAAGADGEALLTRTQEALKKAESKIGAALAGDALANEWITKLEVYMWNGDKDITPGVNSVAQYNAIERWHDEAVALRKEFRAVDFGEAMNDELKEKGEKFDEAIRLAEEHLKYAVESRAEEADEKLTYIEEWFGKDQAWKSDKSKMPRSLSIFVLNDARRVVDDAASFAPDNAKIIALKKRFSAILDENKVRQEARKSATLMKPDKYKGDDAKELHEFVKKLVPKKYEGAKPLRVTIFTPDWKEETVVEWTDSTHSALRKRTTRQLMTCVASEQEDGVFRLFGYIHQDRQSDGSWGPVYGHLTDTRDPMLKENVTKDEAEE